MSKETTNFMFPDFSQVFEPFYEFCENMGKLAVQYQESLDSIGEMAERLLQRIHEIGRAFVDYILGYQKEIIQKFMILLDNCVFSHNVGTCNKNSSPNAPPYDKPIKEIAIENFHYNMHRYKDLRPIKYLISKKSVIEDSIVGGISWAIIVYVVTKLLGMFS